MEVDELEMRQEAKRRRVRQCQIQRMLHEWSFHMKFMKQAFGEFLKIHMKGQ